MREIKFRAWSKEFNKMLEDIGIGSDLAWDRYKNTHVGIPSDSIFMQWTGLKDKDGKEVYEGDVVTYEWYPAEEHMGTEVEIEEITFGEGCFKTGGWAFSECMSVENGIIDVKIIGNIYENPGLAKEA